MNKRMTAAFNSYINSSARELRDVYGRWSSAKQAAYKNCLQACQDHGGDGFRIISANTSFFTVGYTYDDENGKKHFVYITHAGTTDAIIPAWLVPLA